MIRARIFTAGLLLMVLVQPLFGQLRKARRPNVKQMVARQVTSQKRLLTPQMNSRIDELVRICELEPRQKKKLQIAAKGAVAKSLEYYAKYMESVYKRQFNRNVRGRAFVQEKRLADVKAVEAKKAAKDRAAKVAAEKAAARAAKNKGKAKVAKKKVDNRKRRKKVAVAAAVPARRLTRALPYKRPIPWEEKIWVKAISKTLDKKQNAAYDKHVKLRRAFNRRSGVGVFISQMDQQLFLSASQRDSLKKLVDKVYGKQMEKTALNQIYATRGWVGMAANGRRSTRLMPQAKLKKILSKTQLTTWNGQLRRFGAFGQMGGGMLQVFGGGGALGLPQVADAIVPRPAVKRVKPKKKVATKKKKIVEKKK